MCLLYKQISIGGHVCPTVVCVYIRVNRSFLPCAELPGRTAAAGRAVRCHGSGGGPEFQSPPLGARFL